MFLGFDLEEVGLFGSRYFVEHAPVPLGKIALFVTADSRPHPLGGVCTPYVFVIGTEHAPGLRPWIDRWRWGGLSPSACSAATCCCSIEVTTDHFAPARSHTSSSRQAKPLYHTPEIPQLA